MEKKSTLLAFFKPINSGKTVEKPKEKELNEVIEDKKIVNNEVTNKDGNLDASNIKTPTGTEAPKEKRKRKAVDDVEKSESKKKLKADKPSTPATPSIHSFFKRVNNTPVTTAHDKSKTEQPSEEITRTEIAEDVNEKVVKEIETDKVETNITETAIEYETGARNTSPIASKDVKPRKKSSKNIKKADINDSEVVIDENSIDKTEKEKGKISANIFGKKASTRRSKERVRHDSNDSDVSLEWQDDPNDLDFDITESDEKAKVNKAATTSKEDLDKKQRSIKDAFSAMFQKKTKTVELKLDNNLETTENTTIDEAKDEAKISVNVNEEKVQNMNAKQEAKANNKEENIKENDEANNETAETKQLTALQVKDACLMKMLSALSAVADDIDENVEEEELDFTPRTKKKKKKVFTPVLNPSNKTNSLVESPRTPHTVNRAVVARRNCLEFADKENEKEEIKEQIEAKKEYYTVVCKGIEGKLYMDKFISGGVGDCILYNGTFMTPNKFELETGCRGKKYKQSLYINKKPMVYLLKDLGLEGQTLKGSAPRTPGGGRPRADSRADSSGRDTPTLSSGRATPCSGRATPVNLPATQKQESEHSVKQKSKEKIENKESTKKPSKKKQRIDSFEKENDTENQVETPITEDLDNDNDSGKI